MKHLYTLTWLRIPRCNKPFGEGDTWVEAAMHSDCDDCRAAVMVGPMNQKGCGLTKPPNYEPQPAPDADEALENLRRRRDGR